MAILEWHHCSQFENPEPRYFYTMPVELQASEHCLLNVEFFVDGLSLIFKQVTIYQGHPQTDYYYLGEFPDLLDNNAIMELIKRYAEYVMLGYMETFNLTHCPSFERIDNVDDRYNPLPFAD